VRRQIWMRDGISEDATKAGDLAGLLDPSEKNSSIPIGGRDQRSLLCAESRSFDKMRSTVQGSGRDAYSRNASCIGL